MMKLIHIKKSTGEKFFSRKIFGDFLKSSQKPPKSSQIWYDLGGFGTRICRIWEAFERILENLEKSCEKKTFRRWFFFK